MIIFKKRKSNETKLGGNVYRIMVTSRLALLALAATFSGAASADEIIGARTLALSPDGSKLAFTYQGDIWVAPSSGGKAIPLTDNVEMDERPVWSPDGKQIAFASDRYGNFDVFVVDAEGGRPKRITFHSGSDVPSSWTPDGKNILLNRRIDDGYTGTYSINVETGALGQYFLDFLSSGDAQALPEGNKVLYRRIGFPWQRARYQGSAAAQLWLFDKATGERKEIRANGYQHLWHQATEAGFFAVTMTDPVPSSSTLTKSVGKVKFTVGGTPNVYRIDAKGGARRLTEFAGDGVRYLTASRDGKTLAFERDGEIFTLVPGKAPVKISITANIDEKVTTEERLVLTDGVSSATLSPDGSTVVFSAQSEIWSVPTKKSEGPNKDDATQWTDWAGIDESPTYTPDGKAVFFISDRDGSERLYRLDLATKKATVVSTEDAEVTSPTITPDKKFIAYQQYGANGGIYKVSIDGGKPELVVKRPGRSFLEYSFSPDSRYVAYVETLVGSGYYYWESGYNVMITDLQAGKTYNVTQTNQENHAPTWTPDGKYLYYTRGDALIALPLKPEELRGNEITMKYEKPKDAVKVEIDFDEIETRSRRLVNFNGREITFDKEDGSFYYRNGDGIFKADYNGENSRRVTASGGFELSDDGKTLLVTQNGRIATINLRAPGFPATPIGFRAEFVRDLAKVRKAAYWQFWRGYNNKFYDPNFHGRDWVAIGKKYEKFLPSVGHRSEMSNLLGMMTGELEASHAEVSPAGGGRPSQSTANLGFTFDWGYTGKGIKIKEVPKRTPGSYAKTKLNAGEVVLKVNGKEVGLNESLFRDVLNDQSGRELTLTVQSTDGKTREVKYRALNGGEYGGIITANRLEARRKYVETKSNNKVAYLHISGMNQGALDTFQQQLWQYARGKEAVIIDVRGNGGGNTADKIIDILERKHNMAYVPRDEEMFKGPGQVLDMPIVVMMDESSFSNAEMFPEAMRTRKLAKLVGRKTSGYVIYTYGLPLVDGTQGRMPSTGVYRLDGRPMENDGVEPDFDVWFSPEAFFRGDDPQLDKALQVLGKG
jgi:Tol biopolymer transport system component/C-terminal processing protease CtpA/Prc